MRPAAFPAGLPACTKLPEALSGTKRKGLSDGKERPDRGRRPLRCPVRHVSSKKGLFRISLIAAAQAIPVRPAPAAPPQSTPASQRPGLPGIASRYSCGAPSLVRACYIAPARAEANPRARYLSGASQLRLPCGGSALSSCASVCHPPASQSINCWALPPCPAATGLPASW